MKPIAITACLLLAGLSLFAVEPQSQPKDTTKTQPPPLLVETVYSTAQTATVGDSPLVRAAKATRRPGKKTSTTVITNDTLVRTGGHFTTTTPEAQKSLPAVKKGVSAWDQLTADANRKTAEATASTAAAADARKAEDQKRMAAARAAAIREGDTPEALYSDPAVGEGPIQTLKPTSPSTTGQPAKPPL